MNNLKPCPFCGGEAEIFDDRQSYPQVMCKMRCTLTNGFSITKDEFYSKLFSTWNTRAPDKTMQDAFEQVCGLLNRAEKIIAGSISMQDEYTRKQEEKSGFSCDVYLMPVEREWVTECSKALTAAEPFLKKGV